MKIAPIAAELSRRPDEYTHVLVHTGQHYDREMSALFLEELGLGDPAHLLGVGSGSHAQQTARVMEELEPVLLEEDPDIVLVPGDVNSTLASAIVAAKLCLPIGHVEAGLRSFDRTMPEEINRVLTDSVAELLFTHSPEAQGHLLREGIQEDRIHYVGNTMIDTLEALRHRIEVQDAPAEYGLSLGEYLLVTLHRPALVDGPLLRDALAALESVAREMPVIFPAHPRTQARVAALGMRVSDTRLIQPVGYLEFLSLLAGARGVITDSGGIQEETTYLGIPCFTLRDNTERPVTIELGTNVLLGLNPTRIAEVPELLVAGREGQTQIPPLWDGQAAKRIVDVLPQVREQDVLAPALRARA